MEKQQNKEKLSDRAFARLILTSFLSIAMCIICLCSTTWAWFSESVPSSNNEIKTAGECQLSVSVKEDGENETQLDNIENGVELKEGASYTVTLSLPKGSASGYCIISTDTQKYYTDFIKRHDDEQAKMITFTLTVATTKKVYFTTHWGIYSGECSVQNGSLHIN